MYICIYVYISIYTYIYIYISLSLSLSLYIYIYIYPLMPPASCVWDQLCIILGKGRGGGLGGGKPFGTIRPQNDCEMIVK